MGVILKNQLLYQRSLTLLLLFLSLFSTVFNSSFCFLNSDYLVMEYKESV